MRRLNFFLSLLAFVCLESRVVSGSKAAVIQTTVPSPLSLLQELLKPAEGDLGVKKRLFHEFSLPNILKICLRSLRILNPALRVLHRLIVGIFLPYANNVLKDAQSLLFSVS